MDKLDYWLDHYYNYSDIDFRIKVLKLYSESHPELIKKIETDLRCVFSHENSHNRKIILEYFYNKSPEELENFVTSLFTKPNDKFADHKQLQCQFLVNIPVRDEIKEFEYLEQINVDLYNKIIDYIITFKYNEYVDAFAEKLKHDDIKYKKYLISCSMSNKEINDLPLIIRNYEELCKNYILYGSNIFKMNVIENKYWSDVEFLYYPDRDYLTDPVINSSPKELEKIYNFLIINFNINPGLKSTIIENYAPHYYIKNEKEYTFRYNNTECTVYEDMLTFFYYDHYSESFEKLTSTNTEKELYNIYSKCIKKYGTSKIFNVQTSYKGYFEENALYYYNECSPTLIVPGTKVWDFFMKLNNKEIFTSEELTYLINYDASDETVNEENQEIDEEIDEDISQLTLCFNSCNNENNKYYCFKELIVDMADYINISPEDIPEELIKSKLGKLYFKKIDKLYFNK